MEIYCFQAEDGIRDIGVTGVQTCALQALQERQMISLEDAAVVRWPAGYKKPMTHQLHSTTGGGATWGAFWGFLFGLIFFMPFLGAAVGAGTGALSGSLTDVGIDDD